MLLTVRGLPPARYPADQWAVAKSLFRVLRRALVELQLVFAEHNQCDFTELSLLARHALSEESGADDLAAALGARLQHLLVDEMQDTSTGQYDLIEMLTKSWDGHSQTVFLVGDPRQSIYLFRQARVERFMRATRTGLLGALPLTRLQLTANFRSQCDLVDRFNQDFALIFPQPVAADPYALPYSAADATLPASPDARGLVWHPHPLPYVPRANLASPATSGMFPTVAQLRHQPGARDAREIRRIAQEWFARPLPPGRTKPWTLAVLVRNRSHLAEIVTEFENDKLGKVPYRAVEITPLSERQEILDLTALTRAMLHPADRVATLAVLRAPWCGLSLADLHTLTGSDDPAIKRHSILRLIADRGHLLPDESRQRLARVRTVLQAAAAQRSRLTTAQLVERAWRSLGGDAWLNSTELTNARRFFQLLDSLEAAGAGIDPDSPRRAPARALRRTQPHSRRHSLRRPPYHPQGQGPGMGCRLRSRARTHARHRQASPPQLVGGRLARRSRGRRRPRHARSHRRPRRGVARRSTNGSRASKPPATPPSASASFTSPAPAPAKNCTSSPVPTPQSTAQSIPHYLSLLKSAWPAAEPHFQAPAAAAPKTAGAACRLASPWLSPPRADWPRPTIQRLPLTFDPAARFAAARVHKLPYGEPADDTVSHTPFSRPEGSFAARSFGNAVHACLEILSPPHRSTGDHARRARSPNSPRGRRASPPCSRADGLPRATVDALTRETLAALEQRAARSRRPLAARRAPRRRQRIRRHRVARHYASPARQPGQSVRVDRIFHAGPEPHAPGEDFLWIVDYKTATHSPAGLDDFLATQRATYGPQLETYARILAPARSKSPEQVRLALYFPAIPRLIWWNPRRIQPSA